MPQIEMLGANVQLSAQMNKKVGKMGNGSKAENNPFDILLALDTKSPQSIPGQDQSGLKDSNFSERLLELNAGSNQFATNEGVGELGSGLVTNAYLSSDGDFSCQHFATESVDFIVSDLNILENQEFTKFLAAHDQVFLQAFEMFAHIDATSVVDGNSQLLSLNLYVPLSSLATGHLAQVDTNIHHVDLNSINMSTALESKTGSNQRPFINVADSSKYDDSQISQKYAADVNAERSIVQSETETSIEKKIREPGRLEKSMFIPTSEFHKKQFSILHGEDGVSLWYRDFQGNESKMREHLLRIKAMIENKWSVKQIGINGKVVETYNFRNLSKE